MTATQATQILVVPSELVICTELVRIGHNLLGCHSREDTCGGSWLSGGKLPGGDTLVEAWQGRIGASEAMQVVCSTVLEASWLA